MSLLNSFKGNQRLPSANKQGEENLYQFFYKQNLCINDELIMKNLFFKSI
jgi:hypothetical protein